MTEVSTKGRGWQGAMLKLLGGDDFTLTVTRTEQVTDHYLRIGFDAGGVFTKRKVHPTMWIRLWFEAEGQLHQRGYTLVDPDPAADTFDVEFALHDGTAARWAQQAAPGDVINATVMGSKFDMPDPSVQGLLIAGDTASLAAINSLLAAVDSSPRPDTPATIWFEYQHDSDKQLPLRARAHDTVHWVPREGSGQAIVDRVRAAAFDASDHYGWVALESASTRAVTAALRNDFKLGKKSIKSQAYWIQGKSFA